MNRVGPGFAIPIVLLSMALLSTLSAADGKPTEPQPAEQPTVDIEMLRRKQEHQQRARDLARELVSSILDIQLQQLSENGLEHLPLYRDISQMRSHLDGLVEAEMAEVVTLLLKAQDQPPAEREATFVIARKKTREVVVRLSIERQNLLRRLKTAELAAQVKRLISMQTIVANATQGLPEQPGTRQEAALVTTIQDERDVQALFGRLLEMLREVRGWGGEVGQGAAEGLAALRASAVDQHLAEAIAELELAEFAAATREEAAVLKALRLLLEQIEETQGLVSSDRELALEHVRELIADERQLRDDTQTAELDEGTIDKLIERQAGLQKEIGKLPEMLNRLPAAQSAIETARRAAAEASARIFDGKRDEAAAQQATVAAQLASVEQQLLAAATRPDEAQSAAELEKLAQALAEAQQRIAQAQGETSKSLQSPQTEAANRLEKAKDSLLKIDPHTAFPTSVKAAIDDATELTSRAAAAAQDQNKRPEGIQQATDAAARAQRHAESEVAAALADARRNALTARYEELTKSAEALDRAAGAQRDIAAAAQAASAEGLKPEAAKALAAREATVAEVANKVAEAVAREVPEVAAPLKQASTEVDSAQRQLAAAAEPKSAANAKSIAQQAGKPVAPLVAAADKLRAAAAQAARRLAEEADRQLSQLAPVRDAAAMLALETEPPDETVRKLSEAEQNVRTALADQYRASGKPEAARAADLAHRLQMAERQQQSIARSAPSAAPPADDAAVQEHVAELLREAQRAAEKPAQPEQGEAPLPARLSQAVEQARQAAAAAAKAMQAGDATAGQREQKEAEAALAAARQMAEEEAREAGERPAKKPAAELQPRVTRSIEQARQLARHARPQVDEPLERAMAASTAAEQKLQAGQGSSAQAQQQNTAAALEQAAQSLREAIDEQTRKQADQLAAKSKQATQLAAQAAAVDPAALAALQSAEAAGKQAVVADPDGTLRAAQQMNGDLQRAAASLAARDSRLRLAEAMAGKLLKASEAQKAAAARIDADRQALAAADRQAPAGARQSALAKPAAQLEQAMDRYARAARAADQAAAEAAETSGVADPAVLKALEAAAKLRLPPAATAAPAAAAAGKPKPTEDSPATGQLSAEETARLLAGSAALAELQAAQAAAQQPAKPSSAAARPQASAQAATPGQPAPNSGQSAARSSEGKRGPSEPGARGEDTHAGQRTFREEPWVAKLPPALRQAIRAQSQRRPPAAYEERLRRYFENVD